MKTIIRLNLAIYCCFFTLMLTGQSLIKNNNDVRQPLEKNYADSAIHFGLIKAPENYSVADTLDYYWYKGNKVIKTQGGFSGKLLHGDYLCYYADKQLKEKGAFHYGLKSGEWKTWQENGNLLEVSNWKKGTINGSFRSYDDKGELMLQCSYKDGMLHGPYKTYGAGVLLNSVFYMNDRESLQEEKNRRFSLFNFLKKKEKFPGTERKKLTSK